MKYTGCILLLLISMGSYAQSYKKTDWGITATIGASDLEIRFYTSSIVRVSKSPVDKPYTGTSLSVTAKPGTTVFSVKKNGIKVDLRSDKLEVGLDLESGAVSFTSLKGEKLLVEKPNSALFAPFDDAGDSSFHVYQSFQLDRDEPIYGLGQHQRGNLDQRNQKYHLDQGNTEDAVPFFQSVKGYGLFWDNYSATDFVDDAEGTSFRSEAAGGIDYYFIYGGKADGVIAGMRELTGEVPMIPLWTFGYWQSRERYKSQDELVEVVRKYRELGVPLDGIIQDWQYWGNNYLWNAMEFLNTEFYDPKKMVEEVHGLHAHMIISIWSSFGPQTKPYRELDAKGMLFNFATWPQSGSEKWPPRRDYPSGVKVYDVYNPAARDIYWKYANKGLFSLGIDGWWMDSSEPDHLDPKPSDYDTKTFMGSFRKVCNAYPLMSVGGVYDHQRKVGSDKRVFILTRSAFAGQQRYGANTWSGDVVASWDALRKQIPTGLNFSLSGIPYWNSDIGGFFLWNFKKKLEDPEYRELYTRWLEFGAFCPMMRSHGTDAPKEIYQFGKKGDKVVDAIEKFINLRYALLPYIYSASHDVTFNHSSMMRALVMDFAHDQEARKVSNAFLFGRSLLVNPVTEPMYVRQVIAGKDTSMAANFETVKNKETYLPGGTDWYDFWTGERFSGGGKATRETPLDIIPVYVKAGSILPVGPNVQYATEKRWDSLEIRIYPGEDGKFVLYEDENDNYNYEKGVYSTITFNWDDRKKILTIGERNGSFPGMLQNRVFRILLVKPRNSSGYRYAEATGKLVNYIGKKVWTQM